MRRLVYVVVVMSTPSAALAACGDETIPAAPSADGAGASSDAAGDELHDATPASDSANVGDGDVPCTTCAPTLLASGLSIRQIQEHGGRLYWTDGATISSMPSAGGSVSVVAADATATSISVDATGVYWVTESGDAMRSDLDGANASVVATHGDLGVSAIKQVAVDGNDGLLFWTGFGFPGPDVVGVIGNDGALSPDGGFRSPVPTGIGVSSSAHGPFGVGKSITWLTTMTGSMSRHSSLVAWRSDAMHPVELAFVGTSTATELGSHARHRALVYWVEHDRTAKKVSVLKSREITSTTTTDVRAFGEDEQIGSLLVDQDAVYLSRNRSRIWKLPRSGGPLTAVVDLPPPYSTTFMDASVEGPVYVIQDATKLYLATESAIYVHAK